MPAKLIQTLVPGDVGKWVKQQAKREGVSTAAWLRRLCLREYTRNHAAFAPLGYYVRKRGNWGLSDIRNGKPRWIRGYGKQWTKAAADILAIQLKARAEVALSLPPDGVIQSIVGGLGIYTAIARMGK